MPRLTSPGAWRRQLPRLGDAAGHRPRAIPRPIPNSVAEKYKLAGSSRASVGTPTPPPPARVPPRRSMTRRVGIIPDVRGHPRRARSVRLGAVASRRAAARRTVSRPAWAVAPSRLSGARSRDRLSPGRRARLGIRRPLEDRPRRRRRRRRSACVGRLGRRSRRGGDCRERRRRWPLQAVVRSLGGLRIWARLVSGWLLAGQGDAEALFRCDEVVLVVVVDVELDPADPAGDRRVGGVVVGDG